MAGRAGGDDLLEILAILAPGQDLRSGIERIIKSGKGAIIVLGNDDLVESIVSGGFRLETDFSAERLSEVAKMDGAIIVDDEVKTLVWANVHLVPDPSIPTSETGTRHRSAERTAIQSGKPVISVSESTQIVTLYFRSIKRVLEDSASILFRANQALSTLERYRNRLDEVSSTLSALEVENVVTLRDVLVVLQRAEMVKRIAVEIDHAIAELGTDGRLLQLQLDELMLGVGQERTLVVRDYLTDRRRRPEKVMATLQSLPAEDLLDLQLLARSLGHTSAEGGLDRPVSPRGHRLLSRIPRLPDHVIVALVERFGSLQRLMEATLEELDAVEGIGEARARSIREGLQRFAESSILDRFG